jgi:hypothetical protein
VLLAGFAVACASSWEQAQSLDTPAAYHRFLRENPESKHAEPARERIAYLRLQRQPSLEALEAFQREFPESVHRGEVEVMLEAAQFAATRAVGTPAAYAAFLERYPSGTSSARVRAELEYRRQGGFVARPEQLPDFIARFPESDHAEEARRTVATLALRERTRIGVVELSIDVDPATPGADDLARRFAERAAGIYESAGVGLIAARPEEGAEARAAARLAIRHTEVPVRAELSNGRVSRGGILATTRVTLQQSGAEQPIWSRTFEFRGGTLDQHPERSLLFSARAQRYWASFFVPVATWSTDAAVRPALPLRQAAVDLAVNGDRAIVLAGDGTFQVLNIADPQKIEVLSEYARPRDLTKWSGVRFWGGRVVVYGHDGVEIVALASGRPERIHTFGREQVGSIETAAVLDDALVIGGSRGLLLLSDDPFEVTPLRAGPIQGAARVGSWLLFVDHSALHVSTLEGLRGGQIVGSLRLGRVFGTARIRPSERGVSLVANGSFTRVDLANPAQPRVVSQLRAKHVGVVNDVVWVGGRTFLLGERGLLLLDPSGARAVDSADVRARMRLDATGRHLVAIDQNHLQVIDATPFAAVGPAPAALAR